LVGWGLTALSAQIGHIVPFINVTRLRQSVAAHDRAPSRQDSSDGRKLRSLDEDVPWSGPTLD